MLSIPAAVLAVCAVGSQTVLLDFTATWCGPCRSMAPIVDGLASAGYPVRKVDIDREPELARQFRVEGVPCFVLVVDGREVDRVTGATSRERLLAMCERGRSELNANSPTVVGSTAPVRLTSSSNGPRIRGQSPDPRSARPMPLPPMAGGPAVSLAGAVAIDPPGVSTAMPRADAQPAPPAASLASAPQPTASQTPPPAAQPAPERTESRPTPNENRPYARALAASVRLRIEDEHGHSWGSGTVIDSHERAALILTCGHVFRDSKGQGRITVDLFGEGAPQGLRGYVISYDLKRDIGLLRIETESRVPAIRVALDPAAIRPGDEVASIGCASGGEPQVHPSRINSVNKFLGPPNLQVAGQPVQGRSGGGLFNRQGELIGICNAADPADNEGLFAALPSVHAVLDEARLTQVYRIPREVLAAAPTPAPTTQASVEPAAAPAEPRPSAADSFASFAAPPVRPATVRPASPRTPAVSPADDLPHHARGRGPLSPLARRSPEAARFADLSPAAMPATLAARPVAHRVNDPLPPSVPAAMVGAGHAEVVCVIRSLHDPNAKSEVVVLDRASPEFVRQLAAEQQVQKARHMTSLAVPKK